VIFPITALLSMQKHRDAFDKKNNPAQKKAGFLLPN
jgi:hypothetical protein